MIFPSRSRARGGGDLRQVSGVSDVCKLARVVKVVFHGYEIWTAAVPEDVVDRATDANMRIVRQVRLGDGREDRRRTIRIGDRASEHELLGFGCGRRLEVLRLGAYRAAGSIRTPSQILGRAAAAFSFGGGLPYRCYICTVLATAATARASRAVR